MPCRGFTVPWLWSVGVSWLLPCEASAASGSSTLEMAPVGCCRCRARDLELRVGSSTPVSPPARLGGSVKHFHMWQLHMAKEMSQHVPPRCQDEHPAWQGLAVGVESRTVSCGTVLPTPCLPGPQCHPGPPGCHQDSCPGVPLEFWVPHLGTPQAGLATLPGWDRELSTELCTHCVLPRQGNPAQPGPTAQGAGAEAWAALGVPLLWAGEPHSCIATCAGLCILPCMSLAAALASQGLSHQSWPCCHVQGAGPALPREGPQSSARTPSVLLSRGEPSWGASGAAWAGWDCSFTGAPGFRDRGK